MADWDDEGFEPGEITEKKGDAWEGEDEEDDELKENWDDEDDKQEQPEETEPKAVAVKKKKSTVKQKILEKEEKRREEMIRKAEMKEQENDNDDDDDDESIFASKMAEKLENQKRVEEADFELTKELLGEGNIEEGKKSIDTFKPTNREEFSELAKMLVDKLSLYEASVEYHGFLEVLIRDLASGMEAEDVKKLASVLNVLASEKQKAQKAVKGKKKGKKAVLGGSMKGTKGVDLEDHSTYGDEYDDFM